MSGSVLAMAMAMPPRGLLAVVLGLWVEYQLQSGAWAQQSGRVGEDDNPCYLDAELGCAAEGKSCGRISDLCGGTIGAISCHPFLRPFSSRCPVILWRRDTLAGWLVGWFCGGDHGRGRAS